MRQSGLLYWPLESGYMRSKYWKVSEKEWDCLRQHQNRNGGGIGWRCNWGSEHSLANGACCGATLGFSNVTRQRKSSYSARRCVSMQHESQSAYLDSPHWQNRNVLTFSYICFIELSHIQIVTAFTLSPVLVPVFPYSCYVFLKQHNYRSIYVVPMIGSVLFSLLLKNLKRGRVTRWPF